MIIDIAAASANVAQRVANSWEWYMVRGAGFVAVGLIFLLILSGVGQVTGYTYRIIEPVKAWAIHKALAIALCVTVAIHVIFLYFDHYVPFSFAQILVPFVSHYSNGTRFLGLPLSSLGVAFGVLSLYSIAIIVASSLKWVDTKKGPWKLLHYLSYLVVVLIFFHGLYVGTDLKYGVFRSGWVFGGLIVLIAMISRLRRAGVLSKNTNSANKYDN